MSEGGSNFTGIILFVVVIVGLNAASYFLDWGWTFY